MPCADDQPPVPCLEALIAGTVALMTSWAHPAPDARPDADQLRSLLARKIVSNLFFLQHHPHASPALRNVMANAHGRWIAAASAVQEPVERASHTALVHLH